MVLFSEWVSFDENVQVNGVKWFIDFTGLSMAVAIKKYSNPEDQRLISQLFQVSSTFSAQLYDLFSFPFGNILHFLRFTHNVFYLSCVNVSRSVLDFTILLTNFCLFLH